MQFSLLALITATTLAAPTTPVNVKYKDCPAGCQKGAKYSLNYHRFNEWGKVVASPDCPEPTINLFKSFCGSLLAQASTCTKSDSVAVLDVKIKFWAKHASLGLQNTGIDGQKGLDSMADCNAFKTERANKLAEELKQAQNSPDAAETEQYSGANSYSETVVSPY